MSLPEVSGPSPGRPSSLQVRTAVTEKVVNEEMNTESPVKDTTFVPTSLGANPKSGSIEGGVESSGKE